MSSVLRGKRKEIDSAAKDIISLCLTHTQTHTKYCFVTGSETQQLLSVVQPLHSRRSLEAQWTTTTVWWTDPSSAQTHTTKASVLRHWVTAATTGHMMISTVKCKPSVNSWFWSEKIKNIKFTGTNTEPGEAAFKFFLNRIFLISFTLL